MTCDYKILLRSAKQDGFTIGDVEEQDVTLEPVFDLDSFVTEGGLDDIAGFIAFDVHGNVRLVAAGGNRGYDIERMKKKDFKQRVDPEATGAPARVKQVIQMPTLTIVEGSKCECTHGGAVINICKR